MFENDIDSSLGLHTTGRNALLCTGVGHCALKGIATSRDSIHCVHRHKLMALSSQVKGIPLVDPSLVREDKPLAKRLLRFVLMTASS